MFKNSEVVRLFIGEIIIGVIGILVMFLINGNIYNSYKMKLINNNAYIVDNIIKKHPELENEVISSLINQKITYEESKILLKKYGLTDLENINYINGANPDLISYMDKLKNNGGADIIILGVGMDGHLAFNEPPLYSHFNGRMGEVKLNQIPLMPTKLIIQKLK
jgi:hypothetical protein